MRTFAALALLFSAGSAFAQTKDEGTAADANKVICRTEDLLGTRLHTQRTCLTKQQWAQRREEQRRTVQRVQDMKSWQDKGG